MSNSSGDRVKGAASLIIFGGLLMYSGYKRFKRARLVQDTATSKARSAAQGFVELQGYAWGTQSVHLSSNDFPCVYYELKVERYIGGKNEKWRTVLQHKSPDLFYIFDETGGNLVSPDGLEFESYNRCEELHRFPQLTGKRLWELSCALDSGLSGYKPLTRGGFLGLFAERFRITESCIPFGAPLYVKGKLGKLPDSPNHEKVSAEVEVFLDDLKHKAKVASHKSLRFDSDKNGEVDAVEHRFGTSSIGKQVFSRLSSGKLTPPSSPNLKVFGMITKDSNHGLFVADQFEHHLVNNLKSWNLSRIVGGAAMITAGLLLLFV